MSSKNDINTEEEQEQEVQEEPFPIPRIEQLESPRKPLVPKYEQKIDSFNPDLFQLFYSLVNYHLNPYNIDPEQEFSQALETFCVTYDDGESSSRKLDPEVFNSPESIVWRDNIVRKFLLECQNMLIQQSSSGNLTKIALLHNELFYAGEVLRHHKPNESLMSFCDMLMADTLDIYDATFAKICEEHWAAGKTAEDLINNKLMKEICTLRKLSGETNTTLTHALIHRSTEHAPQAQAAAIKSWVAKNTG